jgi:hypothetical protein
MGDVPESALGYHRGHGLPQSRSDDVDRRSIKEECLGRVIPLGEAHLRELIRE